MSAASLPVLPQHTASFSKTNRHPCSAAIEAICAKYSTTPSGTVPSSLKKPNTETKFVPQRCAHSHERGSNLSIPSRTCGSSNAHLNRPGETPDTRSPAASTHRPNSASLPSAARGKRPPGRLRTSTARMSQAAASAMARCGLGLTSSVKIERCISSLTGNFSVRGAAFSAKHVNRTHRKPVRPKLQLPLHLDFAQFLPFRSVDLHGKVREIGHRMLE